MIPYIVLLVFLIVIILVAVYKRVDGFEIGAIGLTKDSTFDSLIQLAERMTKQNKAVLRKLESSAEFDDTLTEQQLQDLELVADQDVKPVSKALIKALKKDIAQAAADTEEMKKKIDSGDIKLSMTLEKALKSLYNTDAIDYAVLNNLINRTIFVANTREAYVNKKAKAKTDKNASAAGIDMEDLYGAVTGMKAEDTEDYGEAPEVTPKSTKEMEDRIAKNVATQLKDSLLVERATKNMMEDISCPYAKVESDLTAQGKEYAQAKPSPTPDMSEYIRKDSIPCWNCSLP
jgi:hypothetical protein